MPFNTNNLRDLLLAAVQNGASDIHIRLGERPIFRIKGTLYPLKTDQFSDDDIVNICKLLTAKESISNEYDGSFQMESICRIRYNIFRYSGKIGLVMRIISEKIPSLDYLKLPAILENLVEQKMGLILVTGATGQGKSTTLAALINIINHKYARHIITIEDPIEFHHNPIKSYITQREIGLDTPNFASALKSALRQDPDVIMVGEMRDPETITTALNAAETGHLVLSTLHTSNIIATIGRILSMFDQDQLDEIKKRLAENLYATIGQRLLPTIEGNIVVATEVMVSNPGIKDAILGKTSLETINSLVKKGEVTTGTHTFDQSIHKLYDQNTISKQVALENATFQSDFKQQLLMEDDN
jgi:twitching motility protein PilT